MVGTELVSRADGRAGAPSNASTDAATVPAVSRGGRFAAFQSSATNLDPADTDGVYDVYVRDTRSGTTTLVSRATGAAGAKGNGDSGHPAISADGRFVAFRSFADNLHPDDRDGGTSVFVRDLQAGTTELVSRDATGAPESGEWPSISADGRLVAFDSLGFVDEDPATEHDIHVRDLRSGTTILASRATGASGAPGSSNSFSPSISPKGRYVAFESQSTNLDPADPSPDTDVYVRDLAASTTVLASRASGAGGAKGDEDAGRPSMSDRPAVAYESRATNLQPDDTGPPGFDVFVRDLAAGTTELASRAGGAAGARGDGGSRWPSISADGRHVAFESQAANLAPADGDAGGDVFVRALATGTTTLASVASDGTKANGGSSLAALAPDAGSVAFESAATNLVANAGGRQVYIRALASAPARARLATSKRSIEVSRRGRFTLRLRAGAGLRGRVTCRSAGRVRIGARRRVVTLARRSFRVPASGAVRVTLALPRRSRQILRRNRRIRTIATVTLTDAAGRSSTERIRVVLRR